MLPAFIFYARSNTRQEEDDELAQEKPILVTKTSMEDTPSTISIEDSDSAISSLSDFPATTSPLGSSHRVVKPWNRTSHLSDLVRDGLRYLQRDDTNVVMLFESPSSANRDSSFYNSQVYKFHDYPPAPYMIKTCLGPCRYSLMTGCTYPSYLKAGKPPAGLVQHWKSTIPRFQSPVFVSDIPDEAAAYAYLPCESIMQHVNDPHVHYHMAGKDAIHLMTNKTARLLQGTKIQRPCLVKITHSIGTKGIFLIKDDKDEAEFEDFLRESGNPNFVVTELIEVTRRIACHFFVHPAGDIIWFGSSENHRDDDGNWNMDSYQVMADQDNLRELQLPFVIDIAKYCRSRGFWGFCGIDVIFDETGKGYLDDMNPRVTGSLPSLMLMQIFQQEYGFGFGVFRHVGRITYHGNVKQLFAEVSAYNKEHERQVVVVLFGVYQVNPQKTKMNIGVYGNNMRECRSALDHFANGL